MDIQLVSSFSTTVSVLQMKKKKKSVSVSAKHLEKHLWPVSHEGGGSVKSLLFLPNSLFCFHFHLLESSVFPFKRNLILRVCGLHLVILFSHKVEFQPSNYVCAVQSLKNKTKKQPLFVF